MFNLTNSTLYVGSEKVTNAYLGENLIFGPGPLEYPDPPTNYAKTGIEYGNFFGSGENIEYEDNGSSSLDKLKLVGSTSYEHNGLNVGTGYVSYPFTSRNRSVFSVVVTFENDFSDMPNDSTSIIIDTAPSRNKSVFVDFKASIYKDSNGDVYVKTKDGTTAIPDEDTFQLSIQYSSTVWYGEGTAILSIYLNDTRVYYKLDTKSFVNVVTLNGDVQIYNPGTVIYDIKVYTTNLSVYSLQANRDGMKELALIKTNQT